MTPELDDPARRRFLQLMGASVALASGACSGPPPEAIVPYVDLPPALGDSAPLYYATAFVDDGYAEGVLVHSNMGRAIKVEGNEAHPASLGGTSVRAQASVLQLWDPERSQAVYQAGQPSTWTAFDASIAEAKARFSASRGEGLRVLTGPVTSPTLIAQIRALLTAYPAARWHVHDASGDKSSLDAIALAFGKPLQPVYRFDEARIVVAVDADFLRNGPGAVRYARDFARRRTPMDAKAMSRVYAAECTPGLIGAMADECIGVPPQETERAIWRIAAQLGYAPVGIYPDTPKTARWERGVAAALAANRGSAALVAGQRLSLQTQALVASLNVRLGNAGRTVHYVEPITPPAASVADLMRDMAEHRVDTLLVLGCNPIYDVGPEFAEAMRAVARTIHCGLYRDETGLAARWHAPLAHGYEQWSDARAFDGTACVVQPVMRPRFSARSIHEVLGGLIGDSTAPLARVRATWQTLLGSGDRWRESLRAGVIEGSASSDVAVAEPRRLTPPSLPDVPLVAVIDSGSVTRGEFGNNAWLHELPHPITKLVWDNAALISPASARALALSSGDIVRIENGNRAVEAPVWIVSRHADDAITLPLGFGRVAAGAVGNGVGFDAHRLGGPAADGRPIAVSVSKTGRRQKLVTTQHHGSMEGRDIVRHATLAEFARSPHFANDEPREQVPEVSLYPRYDYPDYKWGMAIDLNACIGCGACTIACQAENNIPVVGKEEVSRGREMHWIRVDRYDEGPPEHPRTYFQPVPCMHCENAPCEEVCPVGATVHDSEGLNVQVYNRCVGTRFCSQNCPYKVRRFNFLQYSSDDAGLKGVRNPEVTVRQRGVMEKCTYCVQRITRGRIEADKAGRKLRDGEVVTACQAVCPTRAIHFGDLNDASSAVSRVKASPHEYTLLAELNTRPRTTYLARIMNPDWEGS